MTALPAVKEAEKKAVFVLTSQEKERLLTSLSKSSKIRQFQGLTLLESG